MEASAEISAGTGKPEVHLTHCWRCRLACLRGKSPKGPPPLECFHTCVEFASLKLSQVLIMNAGENLPLLLLTEEGERKNFSACQTIVLLLSMSLLGKNLSDPVLLRFLSEPRWLEGKKITDSHPYHNSCLTEVVGKLRRGVKFRTQSQRLTERLQPNHRAVDYFLSPHFTTLLKVCL